MLAAISYRVFISPNWDDILELVFSFRISLIDGCGYWIRSFYLLMLKSSCQSVRINVREKEEVKNGQYRDTGNIGHERHRGRWQIIHKHTTQTFFQDFIDRWLWLLNQEFLFANVEIFISRVLRLAIQNISVTNNSYCKCLVYGKIIVSDSAKMCAEK
jgi:hypothetical protein